METIRDVKKIIKGNVVVDGAGVKLVRVVGKPDVEDFDPFLLLDAFDSKNPEDYVLGFPWHPHRGIETITYLISGNIEHGDSLGNRGMIDDGGCQWMTAGSGIIHQEMPRPCHRMLGAQLWLNIPATEKMTGPKYNDIRPDVVPELKEEGLSVRVLAGTYKGVKGAMEGEHVKPLYLDVALKPEAVWVATSNPTATAFFYIFEGDGFTGPYDMKVEAKQAVLLKEGSSARVKAGHSGIRFIYLEGKPLKETIAWGGPIVMNTKEELRQAFKDLDDGTFIKTGAHTGE